MAFASNSTVRRKLSYQWVATLEVVIGSRLWILWNQAVTLYATTAISFPKLKDSSISRSQC
eukprot:4156636-Amphidinium_carterae.1